MKRLRLFLLKLLLRKDTYLLAAQAIEAELLALRVMGNSYEKLPEPYKWGMRRCLMGAVRDVIENPEHRLSKKASLVYLNQIGRLERLIKQRKDWPKIKKFRSFYEKIDAKWNHKCAVDFSKHIKDPKSRKRKYLELRRWMNTVKKVGP